MPKAAPECHGLDTPERIHFYEQDFYVLSNFSAFQVNWNGKTFATSEHLYHWLRFQPYQWDYRSDRPRLDPPEEWRAKLSTTCADEVRNAPSAHEAFKIAQAAKAFQRPDWDDIKVEEMSKVIAAKAGQHEYVRRKLLATGDRELVENSWRDDFWGWGPNQDGQNMLGKLWMALRTELREQKQAEDEIPF